VTGPAEGQGRLPLDGDASEAVDQAAAELPAGRVVRVLPDVAAIDRTFDYLVPAAWEEDGRAELVRVGSQVRVVLAGRRVGGWVVEDDVEPPPGVSLRPLAHLGGLGPDGDVIELARWAAHRWAGRTAALLTTASPANRVRALPAAPRGVPVPAGPAFWAEAALNVPRSVVRLAPNSDVLPLVLAAARRGDTLVVAPTLATVGRLAARLRRTGLPVSVLPRDWAGAAAGGLVLGARAAALAPVRDLAAVVVLDEHDESLREERVPTWNARDIAIERARRAGVPCVLTSPCPSLEALAWGSEATPPRAEESAGWPFLDVVDRRDEDPVRGGLLGEALAPILRRDWEDREAAARLPVVCVLNRRGRSRLLACVGCGELARCEEHRVPLSLTDDEVLECPVDGGRRPVVCAECGSMRFRNLRAGVTRVREELEALAGRPVVEVTAESDAGEIAGADVYVGTEAVLHRVDRAARVVFLEFDQELLAPRMRAAEQAMALLVRAARLVGPRSDGGRLVVQTRQPGHEVLQAALHADPGRLTEPEEARRRLLRLPPFSAVAQVSGAVAAEFIEQLGGLDGIDVLGPRDGSWLVRASDSATLADVLASVQRPAGRLRIEVDPARI
jgi:primosomal protein N' (replication factor Y)